MNNNGYFLYLQRGEICDLLIACTSIVSEADREMKDPECPEYRREHVLPGTIQKWQKLHDKLFKQLEIMDAIAEQNGRQDA